jgi:hypothetical protein
MKQRIVLAYEFVKAIPNELEERTLYVSMDYATVAHKCCCGCGREVVTPLSPTDWKLTYNGEAISLSPSIGNWSFECQSHYWIEKSTVRWAGQWSKEKIAAGRADDRSAKERHYAGTGRVKQNAGSSARGKSRKGFWSWLSTLLSR